MSKVSKAEERELYYKWSQMTTGERVENGYPFTKVAIARQLGVSSMTLQYWDKNRQKKNKIEVEGVVKEISLLSSEQQKQWWVERMPVLNDVLFKIATDTDIPKATQVKALELIKKEVGAITEKHEITVINPEEVARRGIEAVKELKEFEYKMLPGGENERWISSRTSGENTAKGESESGVVEQTPTPISKEGE